MDVSERQIEREVRRLVAEFPAPAPGFEDRVLSALPADRRRPRQGWAVAAAALLAIAVVATLVLGARQLVGRPTTPANHGSGHPTALPATPAVPTPAPVPTPLHVQGPLALPDTQAVISFVDPDDPTQVDAVPWSGQRPGSTGVRLASKDAIWSASPDGSRFATGSASIEVRDRSGALTGTLPRTDKAPPTWADDSRHLCQTVGPAGTAVGPATLQLLQPGQPARTVAQLGRIAGQSQSGLTVSACSVAADVAVVTQTVPIGNAVEVWAVRLSSGAVLFHATLPSGGQGTTMITASRDGQLLAETVAACCPTSAQATTIRRTSDGAVVAHLDGRWVRGFTWDGQLAVTTDQLSGGTAQVVRWRTGEVLWTAPAGTGLRTVLPEPHGQRLALVLSAGPAPGAPLGDLWIVGPDGSAAQVLAGIR
jgi:hypothetical protein